MQVKNRKLGEGGLAQKFSSLFSTFPRLLLAAACVYGFTELTIYELGRLLGEETLETHWRRAPNQSWVFVPMPDCPLPPPPSTWISACMDVAKAGVFTLMFGYMDRTLFRREDNLADFWKKRVVFVMVSIFQLIIGPMSSALAIYHFITEVYPKQPTFSAGFECFFIGWNSNFVDFAYLLLLLRVMGATSVLGKSRNKYINYDVILAPKLQLEELGKTLLSNDALHTSLGAIEAKKLNVFVNALISTAGIYVLIGLPFALTHKLPAGIVFLPCLLVLAVAIAIIFRFTWPEGSSAIWSSARSEWYSFYSVLTKGRDSEYIGWKVEPFFFAGEQLTSGEKQTRAGFLWSKYLMLIESDKWDFAEKTGYMVFIPILFGMSMMDLILTYGSVYLYHGTGYLTSVELVFAERHADRYLKALLTKILPQWWSGTAFIQAVI
jgi:hypothetical protein